METATIKRALFVTSQVGQVRQAQSLAAQLKPEIVEMAILYTRKNLEAPKKMEQDVDLSIVSHVHKVEIHPASNEMSYPAAKFDRRAYAKLLDESKPDHLFVCFFERHYAVLCDEAHKRDIPISLYEEGTAILRVAIPGYRTFPVHSYRSAATTIYNRVWKKHAISRHPIIKYVIQPAVAFIAPLVQIPYLIGKTFYEIYKAPQIQSIILKKNDPTFIKGWADFTNIYSSSPDIIGKYFPNSKLTKYQPDHTKPADIEAARQVVSGYRLDSRTALFVSQRFDIRPEVQIPIVVHILASAAISLETDIAIKLHPRETAATIATYKNAIADSTAASRLRLIEGEHVPAETILAVSDMTTVIGITSSALMYSRNVRPDIRTISLANVLLKELAKAKAPEPGLNQIQDHLRILELFGHVEQFSAGTTAQRQRPLLYLSAGSV